MHPIAYSGALNTRSLRFVEHVHEGAITHTFTFVPEEECTWKAGQHALFSFPDREIASGKPYRPFSVAASPHEGVVRIGTNIPDPHSDFKQALLELKVGDLMDMRGPFGELYATGKRQHIVGIAGGIGITPFRAIAHEIANGLLPHTKLDLIYGGKDRFFAYEELLHDYAQNPQLSIMFVNTPEEVAAAIDLKVAEHGNRASYFISGSPSMIGTLKGQLQAKGLTKIVNDPFKGY